MVFESVLSPETAENKPYDAFILSFLLSTISIMLAFIVFTPYIVVNTVLSAYTIFFIGIVLFIVEGKRSFSKTLFTLTLLAVVTIIFITNIQGKILALDYSAYATSVSLSMIFFTSLGLAPLMVRLLQVEERRDIEDLEDTFLERHYHVLLAYAALFVGAVFAYSLWFTILPESLVETIFSEQLSTIRWVSGLRMGLTAQVIGGQSFGLILNNNLKILAVSALMSFALGSGAIFILTWNASVIAVAIGDTARTFISYYAGMGHFAGVAAYFHALPISLSRLLFHGSIEILAYFIGGLAGGILSVAAIAHEGAAIWLVIKDATKLLAFSVFLIVVAAAIEAAMIGV
ncbi:MAG: stage II sporulation protein M [archaeon]